MELVSPPSSEVFSAAEIGRAAGVPAREAAAFLESRGFPKGEFLALPAAVRAVELMRRGTMETGPALLFQPRTGAAPRTKVPFAASGAGHMVAFMVLVLATTLGGTTPLVTEPLDFKASRMVFLAIPGPGGGGGGGGLRQRAPAAKAQLKGASRLRSPVPVARTVKSELKTEAPRVALAPPEPVARPAEPPPPAQSPEPAPPVVAPVASVPADAKDRPGVLSSTESDSVSRGTGEGGGSGSGSGTGMGEGTGPGIGPGSGGGTGGGPYRPGSGVTPPGLLREVKPDYTEEARRRGIEGEVLLEIVVRSDGTVGSTRIVRGLGAGLDQRASEAVRQWRFSPARLKGTPVDVMVEVSVEFRIR